MEDRICPDCDSDDVQSTETKYGVKIVCNECKFVIRDVDKYAGVMVWGHKTAPEIEIHANKDSAGTILSSTRHRVNHNSKLKVVHHAPKDIATRRGSLSPVKISQTNNPRTNNKLYTNNDFSVKLNIINYYFYMKTSNTYSNNKSVVSYSEFSKSELAKFYSDLENFATFEDLQNSFQTRKKNNKKAIAILNFAIRYNGALPFKDKVKCYIDEQNDILYFDK